MCRPAFTDSRLTSGYSVSMCSVVREASFEHGDFACRLLGASCYVMRFGRVPATKKSGPTRVNTKQGFFSSTRSVYSNPDHGGLVSVIYSKTHKTIGLV